MEAKIKKLQEEKKQLQQSQPRLCVDYIKGGCFNDKCPNIHADQEEKARREKAKKALAAAKKKAKRSQSAG